MESTTPTRSSSQSENDNDFEKVSHSDEDLQQHEHVSSSIGNVGPLGDDEDLYGAGHHEGERGFGDIPVPAAASVTPRSMHHGSPLIDFGTTEPAAGSTASSGAAGVCPVTAAGKSATEKQPASGGCCCAWVKSIDPRVLDLLYWRDIKKSGVVFGSSLILLLSLALFSVLTVIAYLALTTLTITVSLRLYKNVMGAVQKSGEGHPFKKYLEMDISVPEDKIHHYTDVVVKHVVKHISDLRRYFLVEDMVDSLKFGLLLWVLTYIGAWFNGMTLLILADVAIFTLPKVYDTYRVQIDQYVDIAKTKIDAIWKQVQEKIPFPGKKKQA